MLAINFIHIHKQNKNKLPIWTRPHHIRPHMTHAMAHRTHVRPRSHRPAHHVSHLVGRPSHHVRASPHASTGFSHGQIVKPLRGALLVELADF